MDFLSKCQRLTLVALMLLSIPAAAQTLTWDANTGITGPQNTDSTTTTLIWNTANTNWWDGAANTSWVNSTTSIAQFGTSIPTPATANAVSIASDITLKELIFRAVTTGTIATGQQYSLNGDVPGRLLDFGTDGLIQMEDRSSGGSQFTTLGSNLRLKSNNLRLQKFGSGTAFQFLTFSMTQNADLTGLFTIGGSIYANIAAPGTLENVSRVVVEAGGTFVAGGTASNYTKPFSLAGFGNSLTFSGTSYGAIRFTSNNTIVSGGILLTADAGVHSNFGGANGTTGIVINSAITDGGSNFAFHRFAFTRGDGTLALAAANTYGGATVLGRALSSYSGGTTILDFTAATSPQNDILYNGLATPGRLDFIGGNSVSVLRLSGKSGQTHSQRLGNVTVNGTHSALELLPGVGGTMNVSLGSFSRTDNAATLSIIGPISGSISTTQTAGFIGPWLSYTDGNGSRSWGRSASGLITNRYIGDTTYATAQSLSSTPYAATSNVGITAGSSGTLTMGSGVTLLNTLTMADLTADRVVQITTGQTMRLSTQGGIQIASGGRNLTVGDSAGTLSAGGGVNNTAGALFLSNQSFTSLLTVNSNITNNGTGLVTLVVNGAPGSRTILTGTNTHTGGTQVSSGSLEIRSAGALGTTGAVTVVDGATLALSGGITLSRALAAIGGFGDGNNGAIRSISGDNVITGAITQNAMFLIAADAGASLTVQAASVVTYSSAITFGGAGTVTFNAALTGAGAVSKIGTGQLILAGNSTFTGASTVSAGTLKLGSATALGGPTTIIPAVTISAGASIDLNGFSSDRNFSSISGTGFSGNGALYNNSGTTSTISGTTALAAAAKIGGSGNITFSNTTGLTGNALLYKFGSGTLTVINSTTTSARSATTGVNQIDAGTLRLQSPLAIAPVGLGAYALNGGTLSLGFDVTNAANTGAVNMLSSSTIIADRASSGAGGIIHTLGALTIGGSTLTVTAGSNVTSSTIGLTLGTATIGGLSMRPGNPTFDVQSTASAATTLTLGALSDQAIGPRTITFANTGAATTNSLVTLATAAGSLVDGTLVNLNNGTNAAVTLNLNLAAALGTLAQVTVNGNSVLSLGAAQTIGSLAGNGNVIGAFVLTVGNANNASVLNTTYSGVLGFGSVGTGLTKGGLGTLTLSGANAYTGATTVSTGILKLNNTTALGATSGVTISAGGTLDLNGFSTDRSFTSISGTGISSGGSIINSNGTTGTITGTVALAAVASIGGAGNITINNATGITGNVQLTKVGAGTLRIINTTTTSARTGVNQLNAGTLRLESAALTAVSPLGTSGVWTFNGGTLSLGFDTANALMTGAVTVNGSTTVISDVATPNNAAVNHTMGSLTLNNNSTLTLRTGANVQAGGTQGMIFGTVVLNSNPTFDVQNSASATANLTVGSLTDFAIAPRTITFANTGTALTNSLVTLGTSGTLGDGTVVNLNNGTNAGVTVNLTSASALGALAQVTVNGNSTLTAGITSIVLGSLAGNGTVNASGAFTLFVGNSNNSTPLNTNFSGVLSNGTGTLTLTKAGLGTLTLDGSSSNTHTGTTTVNSGTLVLAKTGGATALGGPLTIGALAASTAGNATVRLGGDGQMLVLPADVNNLIINAGGTLDMNGRTLTVNTLGSFFGATVTGSGTLVINRTGGTLSFAGISAIGSTLQITTTNSAAATRTVAVTGVADQITLSGSVTELSGNAGALTKTLLGTLILSGNNSYSGITTITGGMINIRHANALGTTAGNTVVSSGGTLQIQGGFTTAAEGLTLNGTGFVGSAGLNFQTGAFVNVSGTNNYAGLVTLGSATTISSDSGTLNLTNAGTISGATLALTLGGAGNGSIASIIGTTTGAVIKNGSGVWTLTGVNTSTGAITINAGNLRLGNGTTGQWSSAPGLTFTGTGMFQFSGSTVASTQALGALTLTSGNGTLQVDAPATGTNAVTFTSLAIPAAGTGLNIVAPANTSVTITGTANTNGIVDARLTYNGTDFAASTGGVISAAGTTTATSSLTGGNSAPYLISGSFSQTTSVSANAGLKFATSDTLTISNGILLTINNGSNTAGGILIAGGIAAIIANEGSATGLTTAGSGGLVIRTDASGGSLNIQVPITSTTTGGLTKNGAGTLTLSSSNAYTGATSINEGTLILGNASAMSTSAALVQVGGVLNLNGMTITNAATLNGFGISSGGALINNSVSAASVGALSIGLGSGGGTSIGGSGAISSTGALTGDSLLVKTGAGILTFGNNGGTALPSTRSGLTRIDAGTLRISNSISAIGAITTSLILNGGTLSLGSTASVVAYPTAVTASSTIVSDVFASGAGLTHTLGVLAIGTQTLTIQAGSNVTTASTNAGVTFGATTLTGSPTFDVQSPTTATSGTTTLTLGALSDQGVVKTITFANTGTATTNSVVTLTAAMASLIDGTTVNLNNGTNAGVTLNLNIAAALGTLAQVSVNGNSVLNLGAAQTIGSLSGTGNVTGAFVLTVGNANNSSVLNTTYSGVLGFGSAATGLTKAGLGTLTLSGANAYTGATAVNLGILKLNNASALGATNGVTIGAGGTLDLNGFATSRSFTSISGPGINNGGAIINSSGTTGTITGTVALAAHSSLGGAGNIIINNATGVTGNFQLTKLGAGTLTIINTTTTSARTGANQINAGTLRLESAALTAVSPLGTTGPWTLNGGTLSLGFDTANNLMTGAVTLNGNATVITDVATLNNAAVIQTMGALTINNGSTLTVQTGSNVASGGTQGMTFGAVTLNGNATFDVQNSATATTRLTTLAISDLAVAPRTLTFTNTGAATTNSLVTLATAAGSLVDGTVVNINNGTNAGVTLNLNIAAALGTLAQVNVNGTSVLSLGAAQTIGSLSGSGNVIGAFVLTVGNANNVSVLSTTYSGVLGFGGVGTGLTKAGLGTLTLSGANAYTGATLVSTGILKLNNASALGTTSGVTISAGGTVDLNGQSTDRNFSSISGTGHNGGGALINSSGTTSTISGTTVLAAVTKMGGSGNITFNNTGGLTGSQLLTKFGTGTLTIISTTTSARSGTNQIDEGTLRVQAATAIAPIGTGVYAMNGGILSLGFDVSNAANTGAVNVLVNSTITVDRASLGAGGIVHTLGALGIGGNTLTVNAGDNVTSSTIGLTLGTTTIGGPSLAPGNPVFDVQSTASASTTLTLGAITDQAIAPRTITFQNSGTAASTVTLGTAATSLVDGTSVNIANTGGAITVNLNTANALGTFAQVTLASSSTLSLGAGQTISALNGTGTVTATSTSVMTIGNLLSPTVTNSVFNGVLAGGASLSLVKAGQGSLTLGGAASNTFSGAAGTLVTGGTLILAKTGGATAVSSNLTIDATGTAVGTATVRLAGNDQILTTATLTANTGATLDLNGFNQSVGNLNGTDGGTIQNNASSTNVTLTIGTGNATGGVYLGRITDNSSGTGTVAVTKLGSGLAALGGSSSYSGTTIVQAGSLQVGIGGIGQSGTGATTVTNGSILFGTGVIRGTSFTAASGSTVHTGDGTAQANYGTLNFIPASGSGVIDFQSGSTVILGINSGGTSDLLNFVGTGTNSLLFNGNLTITAVGFTPVAEETFNLLDWSGLTSAPTFDSRFTYTGRLLGNGDDSNGFDLPDISTSGYAWDISSFISNGTIAIVLVPEPSRLLLLGLAFGIMLVRRRR